MARASSPQKWSPGSQTDLHRAAGAGSAERTIAILARGSTAIDQRDPEGRTALVVAAIGVYWHVVAILLRNGASVTIEDNEGITALLVAAAQGHVDATKLLVEAGADLDACSDGHAPLHAAAWAGNTDVLRVLLKAGADPNKRHVSDGATPLSLACRGGNVGAVTELLRAKADPLLAERDPGGPFKTIPLEAAVIAGHAEVVRTLVELVGIEGCGGANGGVDALQLAACRNHVAVVKILTGGGVRDPTGFALMTAIHSGSEACVKFLLQQKYGRGMDKRAPADAVRENPGYHPIYFAIASGWRTPRILRLLIDAGKDTKSVIRLTNDDWSLWFSGMPMDLVMRCLTQRRIHPIRGEKDATAEQLRGLEAIRRLLLQVEAARATSWLWHGDGTVLAGRRDDGTGEGASRTTKAAATPMAVVLPILRRSARRRGGFSAAMCRYSGKT